MSRCPADVTTVSNETRTLTGREFRRTALDTANGITEILQCTIET